MRTTNSDNDDDSLGFDRSLSLDSRDSFVEPDPADLDISNSRNVTAYIYERMREIRNLLQQSISTRNNLTDDDDPKELAKIESLDKKITIYENFLTRMNKEIPALESKTSETELPIDKICQFFIEHFEMFSKIRFAGHHHQKEKEAYPIIVEEAKKMVQGLEPDNKEGLEALAKVMHIGALIADLDQTYQPQALARAVNVLYLEKMFKAAEKLPVKERIWETKLGKGLMIFGGLCLMASVIMAAIAVPVIIVPVVGLAIQYAGMIAGALAGLMGAGLYAHGKRTGLYATVKDLHERSEHSDNELNKALKQSNEDEMSPRRSNRSSE